MQNTTNHPLIDEANKRYKDHDKVETLPGEYLGLDGKKYIKSDSHYRYSDAGFFYDPEEDTLCSWGCGIGLIYRKGIWARLKGEPEPIINYTIY